MTHLLMDEEEISETRTLPNRAPHLHFLCTCPSLPNLYLTTSHSF